MNRKTFGAVQRKVLRLIMRAHIILTLREQKTIEVSDFGINDIRNIGLQVVTYINTAGYCAKEIVLLSRQICPEHRHPPIDATNAGKKETFRCRWGEVYLYTEGKPSRRIRAHIPYQYRDHFTVWKQIVLKPGEQCTIPANTLHWFQAGPKGTVVSEFSSTSVDQADIWTDSQLVRTPGLEK